MRLYFRMIVHMNNFNAYNKTNHLNFFFVLMDNLEKWITTKKLRRYPNKNIV